MRNPQSKSDLFKGGHLEQEIIVLCVRWYLTYKLSYRDLVEMVAERGLSAVHSTILRWVRHYTPEFDRHWGRFSTQVGTSWRVDETCVRTRGQWAYLYRAVDSAGKTVDFRLSPRRNVASARRFSAKPCVLRAARRYRSHSTVMPLLIELFVNFNIGAMLGLKGFASAAVAIRGIELMHRMRKGQFDLHALGTHGQTPSEIWAAVSTA